MRLLLDTAVVLWQLSGVRSLGVRAQETIATAGELAFSVVSFAEIGAKDSGVITAKFDFAQMRKHRASFGFFRDRRPELYSDISRV